VKQIKIILLNINNKLQTKREVAKFERKNKTTPTFIVKKKEKVVT
jgi:hypothetical protein